jgi:TRAP-type mannitol/chloroaromatic compound transport system substrate-binding protein
MKRMMMGTMLGLFVIIFIGAFSLVHADKKKTLRMSSVWSTGIDLIEIDKNFAKLVNELGGGNLQIEFFPGGDLVPPFELFDAVRNGTIDLGGDWGGYWAGKDEAFNIIGSHPMGLTATDYMIWIFQAGGLEVIN